MKREYTDEEKDKSYEIYCDLMDVLVNHTKSRKDAALCVLSSKLFYEHVLRQAEELIKEENELA
jgi:hypothetical protein